ncbi:hypothetical protein RFI_11494 [Reticulomyxa filosa]|uniref:PH domain-containing protein n=1 Tax=Reticulomyxa filosa TaxID=46433 RepID=X6NJV9_RETFI|nr:hypothetical protein RFI_11494 [Reticulomyxa filosa]|eukprot:ETO25642.1 hypothetical protein RFI_11494 [Reticulomyxa filosa]
MFNDKNKERQNRSLSERIQTLDEKVKGLNQNILERDAAIALLQVSLETEKKTVVDCDAKIQQHASSSTTLVGEKNLQIETLTFQLQKIEAETNKEKQEFQEKIQELENALEKIRQENQKEQTAESQKEQTTERKESDDNIVVTKTLSVEEVMSQFDIDECDLHWRIAQQIKKNATYRTLFQLIITKVDCFFNDCQTVSSYADMNEELKHSVEAAITELAQPNSTFLHDFPKTKALTKLNDYFANICKEVELRQLFHNVASFESKLSQNRMTFAKVFSLKVFSLEIFADNPDLEETDEKQRVGAEKQHQRQWHLWVEHACERAFVVLAIGIMEPVLATKFNNARVATIRDLEEIVNDLFVLLILGKSTAAFQERLKQQLEKEREKAKALEAQLSKEKDDEFEVIDHCANNTVHILKEGWLEKAGEHFFSQNQRRKFILWSDGSLFYVKGEGKNLTKNKIDLNQAKIVKKVGNFEMTVDMPDRRWEFKCATINDRDEWIQAFTSIKGVKCESCDSHSEQNRQ